MKNQVIQGDCLIKLKELEDNSVDSIVTDPPYHLVSIVKRFGGENARNTPSMNTKEGGVFARKAKGFMGKEWDGVDENGMGIAMNVDMWAECLRVLKPGGHLLAFSGTRTYHRMASAIEDAGFEVRDMIEWVYGCLSEDTEILTANGWKMLYSIFEGDYVFACDYINDMKLQLEPVKQKFIYDYDEDAYHIKDTGYYNSELMETDHIVSKNHNVLVSESWAMDCFSNGVYPQKVAAEVLYKNVQKRKELGYKSDFHIPGLNGFIPCTIEKIPYKGKVWCVEVESGAFVARRNGKIFITGNSGFPKSLNIGVAVNKLETIEWSKISKALDNIDQKNIMEGWKTNAKPAGIQLSKSLTEVGSNTPKKYFVPDIAVLYSNQKNELLNAIIAEMRLKGLSLILEEDGIIAVENAGQTIELLPENARLAVKLSESPNLKCWNIFTAQCDVKEWLNENTEVSHKVDEALKILRGNKKYSNEEIINVLNAVIPSVLKHTILNQSKTFQNLDTNQKMECVSAINVIITEYTAENLISNTVAILKSKAVDKIQGNEREVTGYQDREGRSSGILGKKVQITRELSQGTSEWEGWGTALKPAHEPICMARKPLKIMVLDKTKIVYEDELPDMTDNEYAEWFKESWVDVVRMGYGVKWKSCSVAENCLKWGTGGINIDESRVGNEEMKFTKASSLGNGLNMEGGKAQEDYIGEDKIGRFPANLIHDNSEEVRECFPDVHGAGKKRGAGEVKHGDNSSIFGINGHESNGMRFGDSGNASRFFKSIVYIPKVSKSERNKGMDNIELKEWKQENSPNPNREERPFLPVKNNHPTVKPIALMEYLIKMVTPKGGIVLDPFAGSGSTLVAAKQNGFQYIGIEMTGEYIPIIESRLKNLI